MGPLPPRKTPPLLSGRGKNADDIRGILDARDYYQLSSHEREEVLEAAVHPAYFVPDSLRADALFRNMKAQKKFFAVVLDEYGGVVGVVSMQDLLEQLVGDFDTSVPMEEEITQIGTDAWRIGGSASLEKVSDALNRKLPVDAFDTFGGYVFGQLGAVPADGSTLTVESDGPDDSHEHRPGKTADSGTCGSARCRKSKCRRLTLFCIR